MIVDGTLGETALLSEVAIICDSGVIGGGLRLRHRMRSALEWLLVGFGVWAVLVSDGLASSGVPTRFKGFVAATRSVVVFAMVVVCDTV